MKLIVGLGNPGKRYEGTRHNVGFDVVDALAHSFSIDMSKEKFHAWHGAGMIHDRQVTLLKPTTFMNRSGDSVLAAVRFYRLAAEDLLVILDDWALPVGRIRARASGSAGSHNGLENTIARLGSSEFARLRIGIGEPFGDPSQFVLSRFAPDESADMQRVIETAVQSVQCWIEQDIETVMNRFNGDVNRT